MKKYLTISNILTTMHLLLIFPFIYFLIEGKNEYAAAVLVIGFVTDFFDGYAARKLRQATDFGRVYDSSVDMLFFGIIILYSALRSYIQLNLIVPYIISGIIFFVVYTMNYSRRKKFLSLKSPLFMLGSVLNGIIVILMVLQEQKLIFIISFLMLIVICQMLIASFVIYKLK